jgi:lipopolysaccharide export system permease protein
MRPGRLDRYVALRFVGAFGGTLVLFVGLFLLMDLFGGFDEILESAGRLSGGTLARCIAGLYLTEIPFLVARLAPFITVTAAVVTVVRLRRANEIVPIVAAGRSARRILLPIFVVATGVAVLQVVAQDHVLSGVVDANRRFRRQIKGDDGSLVEKVPHLVDGLGTTFVCDKWDADGRVLHRVLSLRYRLDGRDWRLEAERLAYRDGGQGRGWYAVGGTLRESGEGRGPGGVPITRALGEEERVRTDLRPSEIDAVAVKDQALGMGLAELRRLIRRYPARIHLRLNLHRRHAFAAANLVLLLIGLPFAFRGSGRSTALGAGLCVVICAAYFTADTLLSDVALRGEIHPIVAAWAPVVIFAGIGAALFDGIST